MSDPNGERFNLDRGIMMDFVTLEELAVVRTPKPARIQRRRA
jgi:hypothetical protein